MNLDRMLLGLSVISLLIWIVLIWGRGNFWQCSEKLVTAKVIDNSFDPAEYPSICVVIPARNEADLLPKTLRSLSNQTYKGSVQIILVDDQSSDGTSDIARQVDENAIIISSQPLPTSWTGKLWAMEQGTTYALEAQTLNPEYILLTDADILHDSDNLQNLVTKAKTENLDLTSIMVRLRCESIWEQWLIPAFVFFFQKLYPFAWVNNPKKSMAAAAGGCILIKTEALKRIGGIKSIRQALIDDCALAWAVKSSGGKIWLGLSDLTTSLRPYPDLETIWDMVARTAYTQLNYSPFLLIGTLVGMGIIYILPPVGLILGLVLSNELVAIACGLALILMVVSYVPTVKFYQCPWWLSLCLPAIAFLYTLMTLDSALRYWQGKGGAWKGRVYEAS